MTARTPPRAVLTGAGCTELSALSQPPPRPEAGAPRRPSRETAEPGPEPRPGQSQRSHPLSECPRRRGFLPKTQRSLSEPWAGNVRPEAIWLPCHSGPGKGRKVRHKCPLCSQDRKDTDSRQDQLPSVWGPHSMETRPRFGTAQDLLQGQDGTSQAEARRAQAWAATQCPPETAQPLGAHFPGTDSLHFNCLPPFLRFNK